MEKPSHYQTLPALKLAKNKKTKNKKQKTDGWSLVFLHENIIEDLVLICNVNETFNSNEFKTQYWPTTLKCNYKMSQYKKREQSFVFIPGVGHLVVELRHSCRFIFFSLSHARLFFA